MKRRGSTEPTQLDASAEHVADGGGDPNFMLSLARGLRVLSAFDAGDARGRGLNIAELSVRTGIPRAAVRRCLYTLSKLGYVGEGPRFTLRPKVLSLGHAQLTSQAPWAAAQALLDRCRDRLRESCSLGMLDGDDVQYVARSERVRIMSIALRVGSRLPAYCTSMGRVLLAQLDDARLDSYLERAALTARTERTITSRTRLRELIEAVRRARYAIVDQELEIGLRSLAVPVCDASGRVIAALNAGTPSARVSLRELQQRFLPELRAAAAELGAVVWAAN
jgi:IclR family transcriptional regulator, pca regulon regulatory protein